MPTNVPPVQFTAIGFVAPSSADVFSGVCADIAAAFGTALNFDLSTPQGQLASSMTALIVDTNSVFIYYVNQVDPAYATGRMQDAIARIYFLERLPAEPTILQVQCSGLQGTVIPVGALISDDSGNVYVATDGTTIPSSGNVTTPFAAKTAGPTPVPPSSGVSIYQAIPGWDSVSVTSGVIGRDTETRAQFEDRRIASVAQNSVGSLPSVRGAVLNVPGVLDAYVTENDTDAPVTIGGFTLVANSLYVAVVGGSADAVAKAIWSKKAPGCAYNGNTTVTVFDENSGYAPPLPSYDVKFERPSNLAILFNVVIVNGPFVPSDAFTQVQNAILAAFAGEDGGSKAEIGAVLYALRYVSAVTALGAWAQVTVLGIGSNNTSAALFDARIAGTVMTVDAVVSGALAVGQTISDAFGGILPGTRIISFGTGGGGTGTYNINNAHTLGATFTGFAAGTTAMSTTGTAGLVSIGDLISGAGVPSNTTIVGQTGGVPGGDGFYIVSNSMTISGVSCKSSDVVTAAVASGNSVSVGISQEPTLTANNIVVSLT